MRISSVVFFLFVVNTTLKGQVNQQAALANSVPGNTYAVVIGISKYGDGINSLDFAHKDAEVFASYLKSKAGGSVPENNIRLLLDKEATHTAIYSALEWLLETCRTNDVVYFYFSGHGDMENSTIYKLGFLLSYNTPRVNYINNAVRIEDLNNIANTLSIKNGAKVVLITDACHSGKLAGNENKGSFLVGEQLRTVIKNEVRITSCGPDQLSNEDEGWGGGRGVFSYYLIKGLEGLADYSKDNVVTVNEIKNYLNTSLSADNLLAKKEQKQNPIVNGLSDIKLVSVDMETLNDLQQSQQVIVGQSRDRILKQLPQQPQSYFFNLIGDKHIEELVDFDKLNELSKEQIPFAFINMLVNTPDTSLKEVIDSEKIILLKQTLTNNTYALKQFNDKLIEIMSSRGQEIINQYLEGDEAELDRRRYYNSEMNRYDVYPKMFAVALKLLTPASYLYRILNIKLHYFSGVAARLKIPTVENPASLLSIAMSEQKKALELEENAAYIHNELGILYKLKKEYSSAEKYYLRATEIAPQWALPWSNLAGLHALTNNYEKGVSAVEKAKERQPDLQGTFTNTGILNERKGNLLLAEEFFRKSIKLNPRHYLPFERLGYVYMNTTQYQLANTFFYEAEKRKKGYHFTLTDSDGDGVTDQFDQEQLPQPCVFDTADIKEQDVMGHFVWGMIAYDDKRYTKAEKEFKKAIALDKTNPLAFHYLGKLLYEQKRWKEGEINFKYALSYYLDSTAFNNYYDSLAKLAPISRSLTCIKEKFLQSFYKRIEDRYFLGGIYESWNHYAEAERQYKEIIKADPKLEEGYYKLWSMYEKMGHYIDAEKIILDLGNYKKEVSEKELNAFYGRMTKLFPKDGSWHYKAGLFLYDIIARDWVDYQWDVYPDNSYRSLLAPDVPGKIDLLMDNDGKLQDVFESEVLVPGIHNYAPADIIDSLYHSSIAYLKKTDSLFQYEDVLADVNYRIGDLFVWQDLPDSSLRYYERSIALKPSDAGIRKKLVHAYTFSFNLKDALTQLDSLYQRNEINFTNLLQMSEYCIHASRFADAANLLKEARQIHPYKVKEIADLNGRLNLLSNDLRKALSFYKEYLLDNPGDMITTYTIARLYATTKNKKEALKWLKLSVDKGFSYYWVLKYDSAWTSYRDHAEWKNITKVIETPSL